ncbi:hypothetical protein GPALN_013230 [Globodera pallida]|nr:hypothetical protein GPALN_013230 [Globodera pallida]
MKCLLLFSLLLFYNGATADELQLKKEPGEIVQEVIDRFEKIAETSVDLTEKLALIRDTSAAFIKLAVPLGALLAASLDIVKKESPESEEYKALKKLNKQMNYQFDRLGERITYSFEAEEMDTELRHFQNFITGQLNILSRKVRYFTDPRKPKTVQSVNDLLEYCKGDNGVEKMAENMSSTGVEDLIVSKTIEDYPGGKDDIPSIRYYRLGAKIHENLKHVGLPRIEKQVLVAPSENSDATFTAFYVCPHYWCSTVLGQRGVDLMVARFIKHHIFDAWSLKKRLQRIKPAIVETLKFDYYVSLPRLVNELEEIKKVKLVAEWQQSAAIVRQKTPFLVNCLFPTITALPNSTSFDSTLAGQAKPKTFTDNNNSIDKPQKSAQQQQRPTTLFPISESPTKSFASHQHPAIMVVNLMSRVLLHRHWIISICINCHHQYLARPRRAPSVVPLETSCSISVVMPLENATTPNAAQCPAALLNCRQPLLMLPPPPPPAGSTSPQQQQVTAAVVRSKNG